MCLHTIIQNTAITISTSGSTIDYTPMWKCIEEVMICFSMSQYLVKQANGCRGEWQAWRWWAVSLPVLRPYGAPCIKLVCMAVVPEGSFFPRWCTRNLEWAEDKRTKYPTWVAGTMACGHETKIKTFALDGVKACMAVTKWVLYCTLAYSEEC